MDDLDQRVQQSFDRDAVRDAVLRLHQAMTDGQADPEDDDGPVAAVLALADVLGNVGSRVAAEGIQLAIFRFIAGDAKPVDARYFGDPLESGDAPHSHGDENE